MSGHCSHCGTYHEEDDGRLCSRCDPTARAGGPVVWLDRPGPISLFPRDHPTLKAIAKPMPLDREGYERAERLADGMIKIVELHSALGLAAPQVGERWRLVVVRTASGFIKAINPEWTPTSKVRVSALEGCLSAPGLRLFVSRYRNIRVTYTDTQGRKVTNYCSDLNARVWQHEIDHLDGVCIWDK